MHTKTNEVQAKCLGSLEGAVAALDNLHGGWTSGPFLPLEHSIVFVANLIGWIEVFESS